MAGLLIAGGVVLVAGATAMVVSEYHTDKEIHRPNKKFRIYPLLSDDEVADLDPYKNNDEIKKMLTQGAPKKMPAQELYLKF